MCPLYSETAELTETKTDYSVENLLRSYWSASVVVCSVVMKDHQVCFVLDVSQRVRCVRRLRTESLRASGLSRVEMMLRDIYYFYDES